MGLLRGFNTSEIKRQITLNPTLNLSPALAPLLYLTLALIPRSLTDKVKDKD